MKPYLPEQLTFGNYGHTLHHCQVVSPDNQWIVYDTRNEDSEIGSTTRIERVHVETKEIQILYETKNANEFGPGVGAATYSPNQDKVLFIHGLNNPTSDKPYGIARRTGVAIDTTNPNQPIYMDARDVQFPFTKGALRGGTHSHCWHPNGELISFTYNDEVLEINGISSERTVGVMFPKKVKVPNDFNEEQISGEMFSVIVSPIVNEAKWGSDEIEKSFDECWLGNKRAIAFQGWVRDANGNRKTEIFTAELPNDLAKEDFNPLEGTINDYPGIPKGINLRRVTYTLKGISNFRHWLRSSPDGEFVYFLMEDEYLFINIYRINVINKQIVKITNHNKSIHSPFNISPDGNKVIYLCDNKLCIFYINEKKYIELSSFNENLYGIPNFDKTGDRIFYNQYIENSYQEKLLQIFSIKL